MRAGESFKWSLTVIAVISTILVSAYSEAEWTVRETIDEFTDEVKSIKVSSLRNSSGYISLACGNGPLILWVQWNDIGNELLPLPAEQSPRGSWARFVMAEYRIDDGEIMSIELDYGGNNVTTLSNLMDRDEERILSFMEDLKSGTRLRMRAPSTDHHLFEDYLSIDLSLKGSNKAISFMLTNCASKGLWVSGK